MLIFGPYSIPYLYNPARTFGTEIAQFCGRNSRDFACKTVKFSAVAATDRRKKDTGEYLKHDAQDAQV